MVWFPTKILMVFLATLYRSADIASNVEKILKNVQDLDIMKLDVKVSKVS